MYSFNSRIRYSEVDEDKNLTVGGIINYFQDCSSFQSEDIGVGFDFLESNHRAWVLNAWQIVLEKYPKYGERITIGTWPYDFRGFIGYRNFVLLNEEKEKLAYANSIWSYLDTQTGRFAKAGEYELSCYRLEERLDMEYADRKIRIPEGGENAEGVVITEHQIDTNHHVNNEEYVKLAMDILRIKNPRQVRVEYKKSALLGNVIYPRVFTERSEKTVVLADEDGSPYSVVVMS
ncbi:MAG TPA: thioesterase [Lachnospiraceae bacterium]|nr:thioesterase [Lachnospiraceae bacterium]